MSLLTCFSKHDQRLLDKLSLTPLDALHYYWRQVSPEDRLRFLCEMLTPNERRAIQMGFEDPDE